MKDQKILMAEAAVLYYEQNMTQQEIADRMGVSRQTVSKLLGDAVREKVVEIRIHRPERSCAQLSEKLCAAFGIRRAVVCSVAGDDETLRRLLTVKSAADYLLPLVKKGGLHIALSWGRTIETFIAEFPTVRTRGNVVFPLFGATDQGQSCFRSNELAGSFAAKIGAEVKYAWFPYQTDNADDLTLFTRTSYYKRLETLWQSIDIAVMGIGNEHTLRMFGEVFGDSSVVLRAVGDVATHFCDIRGGTLEPHAITLRVPREDLRRAKEKVAVVYGDDKIEAVIGALRTGLVDTVVIDEHTARRVLDRLAAG